MILVVGFFLAQFLAGIVIGAARGLYIGFSFARSLGGAAKDPHAAAALSAMLRHPSPGSVLVTILSSYLVASLWAVWYVRRRSGRATSAGLLAWVGYLPAQVRFYGYAAGIALLSFIFVCGLSYFIPPHHRADDIMSSLGETGTIGLWVIAAFSVVAFPLAEEFIFRGFAFKALQVAMRPGYAALAVSFVFVLVHAPEKIHYPPGFLAVTILAIGAIWLRIKSNSVWPPTLLHGLYNAGVIVDAIIVGTHASHIHMS